MTSPVSRTMRKRPPRKRQTSSARSVSGPRPLTVLGYLSALVAGPLDICDGGIYRHTDPWGQGGPGSHDMHVEQFRALAQRGFASVRMATDMPQGAANFAMARRGPVLGQVTITALGRQEHSDLDVEAVSRSLDARHDEERSGAGPRR